MCWTKLFYFLYFLCRICFFVCWTPLPICLFATSLVTWLSTMSGEQAWTRFGTRTVTRTLANWGLCNRYSTPAWLNPFVLDTSKMSPKRLSTTLFSRAHSWGSCRDGQCLKKMSFNYIIKLPLYIFVTLHFTLCF